MIVATQKKLREARFFLAHLERQGHAPPDSSNPEHADFFFSAFVSAARSVTFALQKEEKEQYDLWYNDWFKATSAPEQLLMKRFNEQRIQTVHRDGSDLTGDIVLVPITRTPHAPTPNTMQMLWWSDSMPEVSRRC